MTWSLASEDKTGTSQIRWELVPYTRGRGLDLGCGSDKGFPHFIGVDNNVDATLFQRPAMAADLIVPTCEKLDLFADGSMDFVYSSHLLEHIADYKSALREWLRVIKVGGYLVLYLPDEDEYPKAGEMYANPDHKWDVNFERIDDAMQEIGAWDLVRFEKRNQTDEFSLFFVYQKKEQGQTYSYRTATKPKKTAAVVRFGGIGDMIQAASVLPGLKAQGYHVTLYTSIVGEVVLRHDPHIDAFRVQDHDQVPNAALGHFFDHEMKKYDKWVNLCESVEGTLLALPDRAPYKWSHEARHKFMNRNYAEFSHDLAGVPYKWNGKFYPTDEERARAQALADAGGPLILWSMSGSSVHKSWPYTDAAIARILVTYPNVRIALMGDAVCQMLEEGWQNEPRVLRLCGRMAIRDSLALCEQAALIVGPETGLLNAAGMLDVPKVIMLSHSSAENLTKHWKNTTVLEPKGVSCFPCHKLHYGWDGCWKDEETYGAMCQSKISVDQAWDAINKTLKGLVHRWQRAAA